MEKLYYNLSEEEFSKGRKILIWVFFAAFFLGGIYVALVGPLFGVNSVRPILSLAPFGISLIVGLVAAYATIKRKDLYFLIDNDKVQFRYGVFRPKKYSFNWSDMKEIVMPHRDKKIRMIFKNLTSYTIDLTWIQKKKAVLIRKHFFHMAREKNLPVLKVIRLAPHRKK
jgi:hypothetical protein